MTESKANMDDIDLGHSGLEHANPDCSTCSTRSETEQSSSIACGGSELDQDTERSSYIVNDPDEDDDDSEEIRALTAGAEGYDDTDDSADETVEVRSQNVVVHVDSPSSHGDYLAPLPSLSMSSASVLGRITSGFNTAVSGGLHPLKRSPRVAPEVPSPRRCGSSASSKTARSISPKDFFWGPVMPGYPTCPPETDDNKATMVIRQTVQLEQTETSNNESGADIGLQQAIPIMPMWLAVVCCLLNALSPGLGTFIAGLSLACCSRPQRENVDCVSLLFVNIWVAIFQLISSILFLIGWIWSLIWGFNFITISKEFNSKQSQQEEDGASGNDAGERDDATRPAESVRMSTTTTTAMTRTTTTTVSLPDASSGPSTSVSRDPPIIILQEAPIASTPDHYGLVDAAAAAIWVERQRRGRNLSRLNASAADAGNRSAPAMSRRQRIHRRRQQQAAAAAGTTSPGPWSDPLTGVLLCPEALEHIVVHSSIVPDPEASQSRSVDADAGSLSRK